MKKILIGMIVLSSVFFSGCKSGGGDPKNVLIAFFDALAKKDIDGARKLATADSKSMLDMMEMGMKMNTDKKEEDNKYDKGKMEFGDAKIDGDKATVPVKEKNSGETTNFTLKKEGGNWKVAFDKSSMMTMGMDKMKEKGMNTDSTMNSLNNDSTIKNGMEKLKNMNADSLGAKMKESMEKLEEVSKKLKQNQ